MSDSDAPKNPYLDICASFIEQRFGNTLVMARFPEWGYMYCGRIAPQDGGEVCKFDGAKLTWSACGQDSTYWSIEEDGAVYAGYPQDDASEGVLTFQAGHPREVSELIHLFVQPSARLTAEISESRIFKLGNIADLYAMIASKDGWRVLNLARLPAKMPEGVRTSLSLTLTQNWERLTKGEGCQAWEMEDRWPDFVGGLPDAEPYLRAGYLVDPDCRLRLGHNLPQGAAGKDDPFSGILFIPHDDVSSFYLGEYFGYDRNVLKHMRDAFAVENDLDTVCAMLTKIPVCMPPDFTDQIKVASQTNLLRCDVIDKAKQLVRTPAPYRDMCVRYQAARHALGRMVDACQRCSPAP